MAVKLAMQRWGDGAAPAVLLHGFTGTAAAFDHLRPLLGGALRVAAVDLPGHGASSIALNGGAAWEATLDAIADAIDRAHGGPAHLIGYSLGARLALGVALRHPRSVRKLVLESGSPGLREEAERTERRAHDAELAALIEREGLPAFVARWEESGTLAGLRALPPEAQATLRARRLAQSPAGLAWSLEALGVGTQPDLWPALRTLQAPTLLLHGARDDKFRATAERMALRIPDCALREIRGAGHTPHLERPHLTAAAWLEFLQASPTAADISITTTQESTP